jgi:hypothetical protein
MQELQRLLEDPNLPLYVFGLSTIAWGITIMVRAGLRRRDFKRQFINEDETGIVTDPLEKISTRKLKSAKPDSVK